MNERRDGALLQKSRYFWNYLAAKPYALEMVASERPVKRLICRPVRPCSFSLAMPLSRSFQGISTTPFKPTSPKTFKVSAKASPSETRRLRGALESAAQLVAGCVNDGITYTTTETVIVSEGDRYGEVISESAEECNPSRFSAYIKEGTTYVETFGSNFSTGSMTVKEGDSSVDVAMTLAHGEHPEEQADKNYLLSFEFTMSDSTESIMMYMECSNKSTDVTKRGTYEETDGSGKKVTYDTETREVKYTWAAPELQAYAGSEN